MQEQSGGAQPEQLTAAEVKCAAYRDAQEAFEGLRLVQAAVYRHGLRVPHFALEVLDFGGEALAATKRRIRDPRNPGAVRELHERMESVALAARLLVAPPPAPQPGEEPELTERDHENVRFLLRAGREVRA